MANEVSDRGALEIAEHEGIVLGPYLCSAKVWTDGVGHTASAGGHDPAKLQKVDTRKWPTHAVNEAILKALKQFDVDLRVYETRVNQAVKVPVTQHEFDALVSFDLNTGGILKAILTKLLNKGDRKGAADGFMGWLKPKEITKRRTAERNLFLTGNYDANGDDIPVYDALGDGRTKYRMSIDGAKLALLMQQAGGQHKIAVKPTTGSGGGLQAIINFIIALLRGKTGGK